jgi:hypothetical protein
MGLTETRVVSTGAPAGGHQVAHGDLDAAHAARHRRAHLGVAQVQLGGLQRSLGGAQIGIGLAPGVHALVVALGDRALVPQARGALRSLRV